MRRSNVQRSWYPRFTTFVLSSLFLLFLVFPESRARSVTGVETPVSADKRDGVIVAGVEEVQKDKVDSVLSERIKTEVRDLQPSETVPEEKTKDVQVKEPPEKKVQVVASAGIRRFDTEEPEGEALEKNKANPKGIHIGSETHIEVSEVKVNVLNSQEDGQKVWVENDEKHGGKLKRARVDAAGEVPEKADVQQGQEVVDLIRADARQQAAVESGDISKSLPVPKSRNVIAINSDGLGKFEPAKQENETPKQVLDILEPGSDTQKLAGLPKSEVSSSVIESLKQQAALLQQQIRDKTLFESVKEPTLVMPEVPLLTEIDILESLKSLSSTKKHHDLSIEPFSSHLLSDKQTEIIQCSAAIIADQQRQTFLDSMYNCVRNLSVMNCMRIFVYPIVAETVPQLILQNIPGLPIEVNVLDYFPNRNKTKSARSGTFYIYPMLSTEELLIGMLKDVLDTHRSFESVPSYIDPMNETFVKLLSPGQMRILQMAEKILPVPNRREYSDRIYSCVKRFEYFSCLRYFAWPMVKKYYPALPDFPEYEILYPIPTFTEYPILPFPLEPGQLPEVIEADLKVQKPRPDALILRILKEGVKPGRSKPAYYMLYNLSLANASEIANKSTPTGESLLPLEQMIKTLPFPEKVPYAPTGPSVAVHIPQDQLNSLYAAKQILPPLLRAEFASQTLKCIREVNYYACMKYYTWPIVRQAQPTLPQFPNLTELFQLPDFSQFFQLPDFSGIFQLPEFPTFGPPSFPFIPNFPGAPQLPPGTIPQAPPETIPQLPPGTIPQLPPGTIPQAPSGTIPQLPPGTIPQLPPGTVPMVPSGTVPFPMFPGTQPSPTSPETSPTGTVTPAETPNLIIREVQAIQTDSATVKAGESRHSPVEGEPTSAEEAKHTSEQVSDIQEIPQAPQVQISSRRSEIQSNVPVISITGTEFVPILSEKPETVIFTILRLYQISDPSLANTLSIPFLNSSTPEYNFLTLHQENTILLAKSMLPDSARSSFSEQMISCVRDKDFITCSREVMFPTLSEYFPNLPSFPNLGSPENSQKQLNSTEPLSNSPQIAETNVKTDKHGEATVTITDTRFIPIFLEHPEGVVMNILRALQISNQNLPPGELKTRKTVASSEFENVFSEKQIAIMEIAESLLPEDLRVDFVLRMIGCTKDGEFLDCTRQIAFPSIAQYYPNLPSFPNFGNQLGASSGKPQDSDFPGSIQLLREGFNKPDIDANSAYIQQVENHLQNEIENILIRAASVNERSKIPAENVDPPFQVAQGFLSKQQRNIMRLSDGILPESIRPAYHARMIECMQSSSFVSCMQNVGWPVLRLNPLLLNTPPKPTTEYISQAPGPIPASPIIIPQVEFNYENLGQVQQAVPSQPGGSSSDITSSVGREISAPEIPAYAGQPFASFVDLSLERVDPEKQKGHIKPESEEIIVEHSRRKRSPSDLLDSYPEHDPDENKGSVRKNLSKTSFPNITESELLQLLIHVKSSKGDEFRNAPQRFKKYFVDDLDSEVRKTLTADQVQILRLVEDLSPETTRGIMSQLWQCIRGLSLIRCAGVFIWPMITSNLPSLGPFSGRAKVASEVQDFFGMPPNDFEKELMLKKQEFEDVILSWYKSLMEDKFETNVGFLRVKGHGNGELGISLTGFREGRAKVIKDNKNLPSILTIISDIMEDVLEPKPNSNRNKKDPKKGKSLKFEDNNYQILRDEEDSKIERSMKDDRILAALLEKLRTNDSDANDHYKPYFTIEDAYKAFELLFGTRLTSEIESRLKTFSEDHFRSFINRNMGEENPINDELKILPLEVQEKLLEDKLKIVPLLTPHDYYSLDDEIGKATDVKKELSKNGGLIHKKKHRTELSIQLPRLNDVVISRKITSNIINMARGLKTKMVQMMPGIGIVISFLLQMAIAHARTAASVAGVMSNMALGMGMFSMVRDALFGQPNHPKVKYVYDTETADPGVSWPKEPSYWK